MFSYPNIRIILDFMNFLKENLNLFKGKDYGMSYSKGSTAQH